jgi:hypothetical protein
LSEGDVLSNGMRWFSTQHQGEPDPLLGPEGPGEAEDLAGFLGDLRLAFPKLRVEPRDERVHLAAVVEAARLLADTGEATARSTSETNRPGDQASGLSKPRRRRPMFKTRASKIAVVAVAAVTSLGGLATAGALPRPVQHTVASLADAVGVNLPDPDEQGDQNDQGDAVTSSDQGDQNDQGDAVTSSDQGDQNDQGDTESGDQGDQNDQGDAVTSSDQGDQNDQGDAVTSSDQGDQNDQGDENDQSDQGDNGQN